MAVLKSPRNNKNKKRWSQLYKTTLSNRSSSVLRWVSPREEHKLYKQAAFARLLESPSNLTSGLSSPITVNPFVRPKKTSPLPCNTYFQNVNNIPRIFHPLVFHNVV